MKGAAARRRDRGFGTVELIRILTTGGLVAGEGATRITSILILHTGLIHNDRVSGRIKSLAVQQCIQSRRTILGCYDSGQRGSYQTKHLLF